MKSNLVSQVSKFIVVGVINTAIDLAVLNLLIAITDRGSSGGYYSFFKIISFLCAVTNSYLLNKHWTFAGSEKKNVAVESFEFLFISVIGLILNVTAASLVVNNIAPIANLDKLWPSIGALVGTAIGLAWNFAGYKMAVFKPQQANT